MIYPHVHIDKDENVTVDWGPAIDLTPALSREWAADDLRAVGLRA